jgi:hypothetical protein
MLRIRNWLRSLRQPLRRKPFRREKYQPCLEGLETRLAPANVNILSFHYDPFIQGQDTQETDLTPINVNSSLFGKLASVAVDGYTYAQPLYIHGLMIAGNPHDVAFVSTEHDSIYAFDIVNNAGVVTITQLWQRSFITGGPGGPTTTGITSVPQPDVISGDIVPEIGITGAPVIDPATGTLYLVAKTKEVRADGNHWVQTLHALDVTTGADKYITTGNGGYVIGDTHTSATFANETTVIMVPGVGAETSGGANPMVPFSALKENQRPSLQLLNGRVYVGWASHGDNGPYHGWVVGFNETTLQPEKIFNTAPNGGLSGIWQSEGAISTDGRYLYFAVGNGGGAAGFAAWDPAHGNYSESVLKIDTQATGTIMPVADYFTPFNWQALDSADADLGSGGVMLLPDSVGSTAHPHLMVETGKDGHIYLLDRDNMGQLVPGQQNNSQIVQDVLAGPGGVWGNPAFYQESGGTAVGTGSGLIFYHGSGSDSRVFRITNGQITQVSGSFIAYRSNQTFGFPGANPVISASGSDNPSSLIDWEVQLDQYGSQGPAVLHAYALPTTATGTLTELYNSNQAGARDRLSAAVKFTSAVVTNGLVFVAQGGGPAAGNPASGTFNVFGEFPPPTQPPAAPTNLTAMGTATNTIQLNWTNPSPQPGAFATAIQIFRSVGDDQHFGTTPLTTVAATATSYTDTAISDPNQVYFYKVRAHNTFMGGSDSAFSNEASATPFVQPVLSLGNVASNAVVLLWTRPPVANDHFNVERSTTVDFASPTTIATGLSGTTLTYTDNSAALVSSPGTYYYRIRAFSTAGATPFALSNVVGVKVGPQAGVINYGPPNGFPAPPAPAPFDLLANGDAQFAETTARLTNAAGQTGSVFSTSQENILNWTTTFNVRLHEGTQPNYANGFAFVIQAIGSNALGQGLTGLGYQGIPNSLALTFDTFTNGGTFSPTDPTRGGAVGLFVNGHNPGGTPGTGETRILLNPTTDHVDLDSQSTKTITLSYAYNAANPSMSVLHEVMVDTGPGPSGGGTFTHDYLVDIPGLLGVPLSGNTIAYVGFTGSTGSIVGQPGMQAPGWEIQDILNWVYTPNAPAAPHGLTVVTTATSNILNWRTTSADDGPDGAGYYVERSTSQTTGFTRIMTLGSGVTTFTDTVTNPQQYFYRVQQFNHNGTGGAELDSGYSNVATGATISINFPNFGNHSTIAANGNTTFPTTTPVLRLTDGGGSESSSAWYTTPIGTGAFTTTFTLQDQPVGGAADSVLFVIQNDPGQPGDAGGLMALGHGGGSGGYGPDDNLNGFFINKSIGIKFDLYSGGSHNPTTGLFINGQYPGTGHQSPPGSLDVALPDDILRSNHPLSVTITYDGGTTLTETVLDTVTQVSFSHTYTLSMTLTQIVGTTGYAGFTGGTGGETAIQDIVSWTGQFAQAPPQLTRFQVTANPTSITAGGTTQITVTAMDQNGNPFTGYTGTVHFTSSDPLVMPGNGLPANYTFLASEMGTHTFTVTLRTAGNDTVTATDTAQASVNGTATVTVAPGAIAGLAINGIPTVVTQGTPTSFTVRAVDMFGNTTPSYRGTVHFTSTDAAATKPADYPFVAGDNGTHTFSVTFNTTGPQSITVTDTMTPSFTATASTSVQQSGVVIINYPNGFADQTNLTTNGSASFVEGVNVFTNHQDIGTAGDPAPAGNATFNNGTYTLTASGSDIWDVADHFQYQYTSLTGDGQIIARVVNPETAPDYWTKAGVMFRTDLTAGSANEFMMYTPNTGHEEPVQQWRDTAGGSSGDTGNHPGNDVGDHVPIWLRLDRIGNTFTGYWAFDVNNHPGTWNLMTTHTTVMPSTVLVGLALTAHSNGNVATATFDHVSVTGNPPPIARMTDGGGGEAGSLFYNTPVGPGAFSTTFTLRDTNNPSADSLSFVMQNDPRGLSALGAGGGGGGYQGITRSLAIKFDIWTNNTHVPTTGLFINGQSPATSDQNPPGSQDIALPDDILRSGHPLQITISYDGTSNLTEMVVDTTNPSVTFSHTYTNVNLAQLFGGNAAYVGFTAGTGGATAVQDILNWTGTFQQADTVVINFPNFANSSNLTANTTPQTPPINVFPNTPGAVSVNLTPSNFVLNGGASFAGTALQLTDGGGGEARSAWFKTPVYAGAFNTMFILQDDTNASADSLSFVMQADPRGTGALGAGGGGGGYQGITKSIAIKFDIWTNNTHVPTTGLFFNGQSPATSDQNPPGSQDVVLPDDILRSGHPLLVTLSYDGTTLTESVLDTVTLTSFSHNYALNLAAFLGNGPAFVGFTGGTGGAVSIQKINSWTGSFTGAPSAMQLTDNRGNEATSVFYNTPVGLLGPFTTTFTLQDTPAGGADSLSFVLQADSRGLTALGGAGGGGGYAGISNSIAIKFDLWNHGNHSPYSTGLFTNGTSPDSNTSLDVSLAPIALGSGDPLTVTITYNGSNMLTEMITDTVTHQTFSHTYTINLAQVMGANSAYAGFTAGTGGVASIQKILNWTGTFAPAQPTRFVVSAPTSVVAGTPFQVTVTAVDRNGNLIPGYFGPIHFASSDPAAGLPANYTLAIADNGTRTFTVTLNTPGAQTLTVSDVNVPSITGTASVNVSLDFSNGFGNHNNLMANGSATFATNVGQGTVGIFAGQQDLGTPGNPAPAGTGTFSNGTYTLTASGSDIWDTNDHFHYVYEPLVGDGQIIARVVNPENAPDFWTKAGLMIRTDLNTGSPNEFMMYTPNTGHQEPVMQWRDGYGQGSGDTGNHGTGTTPNVPVPIWLRLDRIGNTFNGYWAFDVNGNPGTWQLIGTHSTVMPTTVYVGLALTAHSNGNVATATFDHVQVTGTTSTLTPNTVARLTDGGGSEAGSVFTKTKVSDTSFTTTFTLQVHSVTGSGDSLLFVLQNDPRGAAAVGRQGGGGGYDGITNSIGVKFDFYSHGTHTSLTGLFTGGQLPDSGDLLDGDVALVGINLASGDPIQVTLTYNGTTLTEFVRDTITGATFTHDYLVNIAQIVGGNTAYAGFTAGTGGDTAVMDIQSWTYQAIPVPPVASLTVSVMTPNLVTNGGFEAGNLSGWTQSGATNDMNVITGTAGGDRIHSGTHAGQFGPGNLGFISQALATTPGASYNLDFWLSNPVGGGGTEWLVRVGGNTLMDVHDASRFNYTHFTFTFTATSSSTDLTFGFAHPPNWFYLDDVSVTPTALTAGTPASTTVTALDAGGHRVAYTGTVHITSTDPQIPVFGDYTFTPADNGQHVFTGTLVTAGTQTVTFRDTANSSLVAKATVVVVPAATSKFVVSDFPTPIASGTPGAFSVTAEDAFGNLTPGYRGTVHLTSSDASAQFFPATYTFTAADNGTHPFVAILHTFGTQSITATDTSTTGTYASVVLADTPVGYWRLDQSPGQTTATDSSTGGHNGTYVGGVTLGVPGALAGDPDTAARFDGTSGYVDVPGSAFNFGNNFTLEAWVINNNSAIGRIFSDGTPGSSGYGFGILPTGQLRFTTYGIQDYDSSVIVPRDGNYHYVAVTFDANNAANFYLDGTFRQTVTGTAPARSSSFDLNIGRNPNGNSEYFNGTIDEPAVYNRVLSATQIAAHYARGVTSTITGTQSGIAIVPASFQVSGFPSEVFAGDTNSFTVTALDFFGNVLPSFTGTVQLTSTSAATFTNNDGTPLPGGNSYTFTAADHGSHTFLGTLTTAGTQSIKATETGVPGANVTGMQSPIVVDPAAFDHFVLSGFPSPTMAGAPHSLTVTAKDVYGNTLTSNSAGGPFTDTIQFSSSDQQAGLPADYAFTPDDAGTHTFANVSLATKGTQSITVTDANNGVQATQSGITVTPGIAVGFHIMVLLNPAPAGTSNFVFVTAVDAFGNEGAVYTGTVHFSSSTDSAATLPPNYTFTAADNGSHVFSGVVFRTPGTQSLRVQDTLNMNIFGEEDDITVTP